MKIKLKSKKLASASVTFTILASLLAGCEEDGLADQVAREQAKRAVNPVISRTFPGIPLEPATNCVIDNASASEILTLASAGVRGATPADTQLVIEIASRPDTIRCFAERGLPPLLRTRL